MNTIVFLLSVFMLFASTCLALDPSRDTNFEQLSVLTNAVKAMTVSKIEDILKPTINASRAVCTLTGSAITFTTDGTTPTSSVGHVLNIGDVLKFGKHSDLLYFQAI